MHSKKGLVDIVNHASTRIAGVPDPDPTIHCDADPDPIPTPQVFHILKCFTFCSQQSKLFYLSRQRPGVISFNIFESALKFSRKSVVQLYLWLKCTRIRTKIRIHIGRPWMRIRQIMTIRPNPQNWVNRRQLPPLGKVNNGILPAPIF